MKRTTMCFILMLAFALTLNLAWANGVLPAKIGASLNIVNGSVKLTHAGSGECTVITGASELYAGDLLETQRNSRAVIRYADGTLMRIKERTLIEVRPLSLKVFRGKTWYKFTKRGSEFKIETPTLVAGIRGTQFEVAVSSRNKTTLSVTEGAVSVKGGRSRKGVLVRAGYATSCAEGGDLAMPYTFNTKIKNAEWNSIAWRSAPGLEDECSLMLRYLNMKNMYGEQDSRTISAKKRYVNFKNRAHKTQKRVKPKK